MDAGSLKELDHPHTLLSNRNSYFSKMVERTGPTMATSLRKMAQTVKVHSTATLCFLKFHLCSRIT